MAFRANQAFTTWVGGVKRRYDKNDVVPEPIAEKVSALVFDDGASVEPKRRTRQLAKPADFEDD